MSLPREFHAKYGRRWAGNLQPVDGLKLGERHEAAKLTVLLMRAVELAAIARLGGEVEFLAHLDLLHLVPDLLAGVEIHHLRANGSAP